MDPCLVIFEESKGTRLPGAEGVNSGVWEVKLGNRKPRKDFFCFLPQHNQLGLLSKWMTQSNLKFYCE